MWGLGIELTLPCLHGKHLPGRTVFPALVIVLRDSFQGSGRLWAIGFQVRLLVESIYRKRMLRPHLVIPVSGESDPGLTVFGISLGH